MLLKQGKEKSMVNLYFSIITFFIVSATFSNALASDFLNPLNQISQAIVAKPESEDNALIENEWRSQELNILGVGMATGDLDGDGKKELVIIDPSTVYVYRFGKSDLISVTEYSSNSLELKSVDIIGMKKDGPERIYVTAQNRGSVVSFVLELRNNSLIPVIEGIPYFLRVIHYPTVGKILLGQRKGMRRMYDGPIYKMIDNGTSVNPGDRFGIPLKIPIFGFTVGDFEGKRQPLIAAFDKDDHIRIYEPSGKRRFVSQEVYGGSDIILRWSGPEKREADKLDADYDLEFFRPRLVAYDSYKSSVHQILTIYHSSKTRRLLSRTKMLEEGQIMGLRWNGDALVEQWSTPKMQGMITDFGVDSLSATEAPKLVILERKKTDWLSFLRSRSQIRMYDLHSVMKSK